MTDAFAGKGNGCHSSDSEFYMGCGTAGRCRHRPLRKRILWCVGAGLSCPPSCQPTDGHCCARQSGHFLETGSLHPPLAALRRFPLPRATARVAPTEGYKQYRGRADVGSELSAAGGRGSEVSEWPRSKFPASAVRQRRNFGHRNRDIRNTPVQRSRRTDCHNQ